MVGIDQKIVLEVQNLSLAFGGVQALDAIDLKVLKGEILAIIGPNGAGKTSLLNCVSGVYRPQKGKILFNGLNIVPMNPHTRTKMGMGRTFQHVELFRGMTVLDNIKLGRHNLTKGGLLGSMFRMGEALRQEMECRKEVEETVLDFLDLSPVRMTPVGLLPQGLQKRVDLGRALAMEPSILLVDEPMAGMSVEEKEDMASFIMDIHRDLGTTIIWIEHDLKTVTDLSDRATVLNFGRKLAEGSFEEIRRNPSVMEAYLGMED